MGAPGSVVVIGASAAGLTTAEALRRKGFEGGLCLVGDEVHPPYDRPPLTKGVLSGAWASDRTHLRTKEALSALDAEFVIGDPAVDLDVVNRTVTTGSGRRRTADAVVVATGARSRRLRGQPDTASMHMVRTLDDAGTLRAALTSAAPVVVVGDGVLGAEVAATASTMGVEATLVGPQPAIMQLQLGALVAQQLTDLHRAHSVRLRLSTAVQGFVESAGQVSGVVLETGEVLPAQTVVVALGAVPATEWLAGSGLTIADGVACDSRCRAADGIFAVGDVARWYHEGLGRSMRLENRTNATEQAIVVAGNILGEDRPYLPVPYFWTDQYGVKLQSYGIPAPDAEASVVEGDVIGGRFVVEYRQDDEVVGVLGWNMPKQARLHRAQLLRHYGAAA